MEQKSQARDERILEGKKRKWENFQSGNSSGKSNQKDNSRQSSQNNQKQGNARAMTTSAPLTQATVHRMIKESVDAAITAEQDRQVNVRNDASGSGPTRGQNAAPSVQCVEGKKVKSDAATLEGPTLTWWNSKKSTMGLETVNQMPWTKMKQLMTIEFCPVEEIQRMEHELWNLRVKEYNIVAYTQRFNELAFMCPRMVELERVKVYVYIRGLSDNIKGDVTFSKPANLNEAVCMTHKLMEQKSQARDERILEGKKR
nr:hypothetical protein [Tanacetum cinerariifolium]